MSSIAYMHLTPAKLDSFIAVMWRSGLPSIDVNIIMMSVDGSKTKNEK